jgi:hypothetical protein
MKKVGVIVSIILFCSLPFLFFLCAPDIIGYVAKSGLERTFPGSSVTIGKSVFHPLRSVEISAIEILREGIYDIRLSRVTVSYDLPGILKGRVSEISSAGANVRMDLRRLKPGEAGELIFMGTDRGHFSVEREVFPLTSLDFKADGISVSGMISLELYPDEPDKGKIDAVIQTIKAFGITAGEAVISGKPYSGGADFTVKTITCGDAVVKGVTGKLVLDDKGVLLDGLSGSAFKGKMKGEASVGLGEDGKFSAALDFAGLDLGTFVKDFKLEEKVDITGTMKGGLRVAGAGTGFTDISGEFTADIPGGVLTIKDKTFLENMAKRTGYEMDMLMENFSRYVYNKGGMKVGFNGRDISLDIEMEGEAGKRTLNVVLHDIIK